MQKSNSNKEIQNFITENKLLVGLQKEAALKKIPIIDVTTGRFLELICLLATPKDILEIGCGSGFSSYFLIKNLGSGHYTGIDLNRERIRKAEEFTCSLFPGNGGVVLCCSLDGWLDPGSNGHIEGRSSDL